MRVACRPSGVSRPYDVSRAGVSRLYDDISRLSGVSRPASGPGLGADRFCMLRYCVISRPCPSTLQYCGMSGVAAAAAAVCGDDVTGAVVFGVAHVGE